MLQSKIQASAENIKLINLFELIEDADLATLKECIYFYDLKQISVDGEPPIIAALSYMKATKDPVRKKILGEIVDFLIQSGADPKQTDREGNNPLHLAVLNGEKTLENDFLIQKFNDLGVEGFDENKYGESPMDLWVDKYITDERLKKISKKIFVEGGKLAITTLKILFPNRF